MTVDHRDQPIFPNQGIFLRLTQEYAGAGGDVAYLKNESDLQVNIPLPFELVLQGAFRFGVFRPLDEFPAYNSSDLFYLGGPHTLRGFEMKSLGPRSGSEVLGGKSYWSSGLHLYAPLPFAFGKGSFGDYCRTHLFVNAGNITEQSFSFQGDEIKGSLENLVAGYRAAYGLGLAIRLGQIARIEINYCWPLRFSSVDKVVRGMQLGIGVEFI
jgi:outer membrane protein insertion porin family